MSTVFDIDEKGFVFIDGKNKPYWVAKWGDSIWLFYWHTEGHWTSLRPIKKGPELLQMLGLSIEKELANLYHEKHKGYMNQFVSDDELGVV